ncbi:hypothetical protein AB0M79_28200 [Polymorphospora sp. NPDC051019]|uniref:hypothetical protein n=1 Tax=Polymorphospora sp. NPDC051019 TaxID=3155725 RepID=UPI00342D5CCC
MSVPQRPVWLEQRPVAAQRRGNLANALASMRRERPVLVVTSPPYGPTMLSRVANRSCSGDLTTDSTAVLAGCVPLLRPDATVVVTPRRHPNDTADPDTVLATGTGARVTLIEHSIGLLANVCAGRLVPTPPTRLPEAPVLLPDGFPLRHTAYEDTYVFQHPPAADPLATDEQGTCR